MKYNNTFKFTFLFIAISALFIACTKEDDERLTSNEPINIITPDSTTIFADAGSTVNFKLNLAIDKPIDSLRAAFLVDTSMLVQNLSFSDMDSIFLVQGFEDTSNVQVVEGTYTLPSLAADTIPFKPYFGGSTTPYAAPKYDAIRIIFKLEAQDNTSYEKQLKIIVN